MSDLVERLRKYSDPAHVEDFYMKRWDQMRKYIANGGRGSYPRDCFESFIDGWAQDAVEAADRIEALEKALLANIRYSNGCNEVPCSDKTLPCGCDEEFRAALKDAAP